MAAHHMQVSGPGQQGDTVTRNTLAPQPRPGGMVAAPLPPFLASVAQALVQAGVFEAAEPPNHVLLNEYSPGQGIMPHKDGPLFRPQVAILCLQGRSMLEFWDSLEASKRVSVVPHTLLHCPHCHSRRTVTLLPRNRTALLPHSATHAPHGFDSDTPTQPCTCVCRAGQASGLCGVPTSSAASVCGRRLPDTLAWHQGERRALLPRGVLGGVCVPTVRR